MTAEQMTLRDEQDWQLMEVYIKHHCESCGGRHENGWCRRIALEGLPTGAPRGEECYWWQPPGLELLRHLGAWMRGELEHGGG